MLCRYRRRPPVFFENASVAVMIWPLGLRPPHPWWFEAQRRGGQLVAKRGAGNVTQLPIFGRFDRRPTVTTPHQQKLQAGQITDFFRRCRNQVRICYFVSATKIPFQSAGGALSRKAWMRVRYKSNSPVRPKLCSADRHNSIASEAPSQSRLR